MSPHVGKQILFLVHVSIEKNWKWTPSSKFHSVSTQTFIQKVLCWINSWNSTPHDSNGVFNFPKQYLPQLVHQICYWPVVVCICPPTPPPPELKLQEKRGFIWLAIGKAMNQDFPFFSQTHVKAKIKTLAKTETEHRYCFPLNYDRYRAITNSLRGYLMGMKYIIWEKYTPNTVCTV